MYKLKENVFICSAKRTPIGSFSGALSTVSATDLGVCAIRAVVEECEIDAAEIDEVIMGCVIQGNLGQAPARQAAIGAGLSTNVQAMTVNKVCSSGLKSVMLACNAVELGQAQAIVAGGMESLSQAPYYMSTLRNGARLGHVQAEDAVIKDGLWDPYSDQHMGSCGELCASERGYDRAAQDEFARESYARALRAIESGAFKTEITPVSFVQRRQEVTVAEDEEPQRYKPERVDSMKPAFQKDGTVTAVNASALNDGAAAVLVCSESFMQSHGLTPLVRVVGQGWHAQAPEWFTVAPVGAVQRLLSAVNLDVKAIDLFELNEAFSVVGLACRDELGIPADKLNVNGGAVALGHPLGATGTRILTTLIHAMCGRAAKTGVAALCNGGGEATALMVERV